MRVFFGGLRQGDGGRQIELTHVHYYCSGRSFDQYRIFLILVWAFSFYYEARAQKNARRQPNTSAHLVRSYRSVVVESSVWCRPTLGWGLAFLTTFSVFIRGIGTVCSEGFSFFETSFPNHKKARDLSIARSLNGER